MSVWVIRECYFQKKYDFGYDALEVLADFPVSIDYAIGCSCRWNYSVPGKRFFLYFLFSNQPWKSGGTFDMEDMLPILGQCGVKMP